jgi:hypothetical protein
VILLAHDRSSQHPLGRIVVERNARIVEEPSEPGPPFQQVAHGLAQLAARQADLFGRPRLDAVGDATRTLLPQLVPQGLRRGVTRKSAGDEPFDVIEIADQRVDLDRPLLQIDDPVEANAEARVLVHLLGARLRAASVRQAAGRVGRWTPRRANRQRWRPAKAKTAKGACSVPVA